MTLKEFEAKIRQLLDLPGNADREIWVGIEYADGTPDIALPLDRMESGSTIKMEGSEFVATWPLFLLGRHDED